jgi:hypothetical protein
MILFFLLSLLFPLTIATPTVPPTAAPTVAPTAAPTQAQVLIPPNCQIVLPPFPLSYQGLITPYQLQTIDANTPCAMKTFPAFAEAVILDLDTNSLSVYHPLIVDFNTQPLVQPLPFTMNPNSLVTIHFGSNGMAIKLFPPLSIQQGNCVYGIGGMNTMDQFGQFSHCNAVAFFEKVKSLILSNVPLNPPIPPLGMASDGLPCPTTRDFFLVDMDPSDNVVTTYLLDPATGKVAQNNQAAQQANPQAVVIKNGSDNLLLATLDKIMGCKPYQVPNLADLANPMNNKISSMVLDEIHAAIRQEKVYAYLPKGDPMTRVMVNNAMQPSLLKLNLYRQGVFQPMVNDLAMADTTLFCAHFAEIQLKRLQANKGLFINQPSPDAAISTHMFGFLANRFAGSYNGLNCPVLLDTPNPVTLVMVNNLVADATFAAVPNFPTSATDPYLVSWDEYPAFTPAPTIPPVQPTAVPTEQPTTAPPTVTPTPSTTPSPTANPNANNVDPAPGKAILNNVLLGCAGGLILLAVFYYCYRNCNRPAVVAPRIEPSESPLLAASYDPTIYQRVNQPTIIIQPSSPVQKNQPVMKSNYPYTPIQKNPTKGVNRY